MSISGDRESRGITAFASHVAEQNESEISIRVSKAYDIKFLSGTLKKHDCCSHVPFLPSYTGPPTVTKCWKSSANYEF